MDPLVGRFETRKKILDSENPWKQKTGKDVNVTSGSAPGIFSQGILNPASRILVTWDEVLVYYFLQSNFESRHPSRRVIGTKHTIWIAESFAKTIYVCVCDVCECLCARVGGVLDEDPRKKDVRHTAYIQDTTSTMVCSLQISDIFLQ